MASSTGSNIQPSPPASTSLGTSWRARKVYLPRQDAVALLRGRAREKRLVLAATVSPEVPSRVRTDPVRLRQVAQVARRHGRAAGFMATDAAWIARAREMGYTMIAAGTDTGLLELAVKGLVTRIDAPAR